MKTKLLFLAVSCLFLLSVFVYAQQTPPTASPPSMMQMLKSPGIQQTMKNGMKSGLRTFWNGKGSNLMAIELFKDPDIRRTWNVTDEQHQQLEELPNNLGATVQQNLLKHPEFKKLAEKIGTIQRQYPGDPLLQKADAESKKQFADIQAEIGSIAVDLSINTLVETTESILTPEQRQKMDESLLASMEEMPITSPSMFESLGLTEEQKQQMEAIKKELEPEFEKNLEFVADMQMTLLNMSFAEFEKQKGEESMTGTDPAKMQKEIGEKMKAITKKLAAENPEFKKMTEEIEKKGKEFATQFKIRMFDVLTDEQWKRLLDLTDNPPEYAKVFRKKIQEQKNAKVDSWQPSADSWKPGDAIPEEYRKERNAGRHFPRQEK